MYFRMAVKHFPDLCNASSQLSHRCRICNPQIESNPPLAHPGPVSDRLVGQGGVGNCHQCLGKGPYPGAAKGNILHGAFNTGRKDPVANREWFFRNNGNPAKNVAQRVLRRQGNSQAAQPQAGHKPADIVTPFLSDYAYGQDDNNETQDFGQKGEQDPVNLKIQLLDDFLKNIGSRHVT